MSKGPSRLTRRLAAAPPGVLTLYAMVAAFATYFCMYAFRKPFAAASFKDMTWLGSQIDLKTAFVISQILGYTLSKYIGIKLCSEVTRRARAGFLLALIIAAEAALLLFAVLPANLKVLGIFLNGLPLGMIWGLVVLYLEGRRTSELLLAGLSCSFIVSSGVVKDVGRWLMDAHGVSEAWMPFTTGLIFLPLFAVSTWLLNKVPEPTEDDVRARVVREPMDGRKRMSFLRRFLPGIVLLLLAYFFITAYRDYRDNYGVEIFKELGFGGETAIFTRTEIPVAFGVMLTLAALNLIKNNRRGLIGAYGVIAGGLALMGLSTLLLDAGAIRGDVWMILVGLGAYLAFVPFGSVLFDRLIASTRAVGTAVFAIYLADAIGYTGSIGIQLYKDLAEGQATRLEFFRGLTYFMSVVGVVLVAASLAYMLVRHLRAGGDCANDTGEANP